MRLQGLCALVALACSEAPAPSTTTLAFSVDAPAGSELYTCYAFDAASLRDRWVTAIHWTPPNDPNIVMHHATLYALSDWGNGDVSTCWDMPAPATGLQVWVPGGDPLVLPSDMGVELPPNASKLVVQVHAIRVNAGEPVEGSVSIDTTSIVPARVAAWVTAPAPIPALRPHMTDSSTAACVAAGDFHVIRDWAHMHLAGHEFHGAVLHADGTSTPLVDVVPWDFYRQLTYEVDVPVASGERVQTTCIWQNDTDHYIFDGPLTTDEMCNQALLVWPAANAAWIGQCL